MSGTYQAAVALHACIRNGADALTYHTACILRADRVEKECKAESGYALPICRAEPPTQDPLRLAAGILQLARPNPDKARRLIELSVMVRYAQVIKEICINDLD